MSNTRLPLQIIPQTDSSATACVIFLHGLGKDGIWQKEQFYKLLGENAEFAHIVQIFPTASYQYCAVKNFTVYSWFDVAVDKNKERNTVKINDEDVEISVKYIDSLVNDVVASGIPLDRIIIGGVSQGAMLSMMYGYAYERHVKGIISLSGFYPKTYEEKFREDNYLPELLFANFDGDAVVPYKSAKESYNFLLKKSIQIDKICFNAEQHEVSEEMLETTYEWIEKLLPK